MLQARFVLITLRISAHNSVDCVGIPVHFSQLCIVAQNNAPELKQKWVIPFVISFIDQYLRHKQHVGFVQ